MVRRFPILLATLVIAACDAEGPLIGPEAPVPSFAVNFLFPKVLVLDEDAIGKGLPPNFFEEQDVNEQLANIGLRAQLGFFEDHQGETITLHSGEVGDEGWFALTTTPTSWEDAGPGDGPSNYFAAGPGLGTADANGDREALLDKIPGVTPLRAAGLQKLQGHTVCAVVYKGDVSIDYDPLNGSLKGDNLGTVAFRVLSVKRLTGFSSSSLPEVQVLILDVDVDCQPPLTLFEDAPEPISSSQPFDVIPEEQEGSAANCFGEFGEVIDCDIEIILVNQGGSAIVFQDPGEPEQTLAAVVTIDINDVFDDEGNPVSEFELALLHIPLAPAPSGQIPLGQQIPFFIDVSAQDAAGDPVFFQNGAEITVCQPADLGETIPNALHVFLQIFEVHEGVIEVLPTTIDNENCPAGAHGGLNTVRGGKFSREFGAGLFTVPSVSTADVPNGLVGSPTVIEIQARLFSEITESEADQILGGDEVVVTVTGANTASPTVIDNSDGSYTTQYTPTVAGVDNVVIEIRNVDGGALESINGSPFTSEVAVAACGTANSLLIVRVTLGANCSTPGVVPTMELAMIIVQSGGTIRMDNGVHVVEGVIVSKPVTIDEVAAASATIQNNSALRSLRIDGVSSGLVTIRNIDFVNNSPGINTGGTRTSSIENNGEYDQVVIEDNTFTNVPDSANSGVRVDTTSVSGATVLVQRNTFTGGRTGLVATGVDEAGGPPPNTFNPTTTVDDNDFIGHVAVAVQFQRASDGVISNNRTENCGAAGCIRVFGGTVDVLDNDITDATLEPIPPGVYHNAIRFSAGAVGSVNDNDIDGCGWGSCIQIAFGAVADVRRNTIVANVADHTEIGILGYGGDDPVLANNTPPTLTFVTDNVITGVGTGPGTRNDDDFYGFFLTGILMRNATAAVVSGNDITNAGRGIYTFQNGTILAGADNTTDFTRIAVASGDNGFISMVDNDFTDWIVSIRDLNGTLSGDVACNWWGSVLGPNNNNLAAGSSIVFKPWTDGPVAGPATASCNLSVSIDGVLSPGEWDDADVFGPTLVVLPSGGPTSGPTNATVFVMNDGTDLLLAVEFTDDLSSWFGHTLSVRLDENPVDNDWNAGGDGNGDDGFTVQNKPVVGGVGLMLDSHFNTSVSPPQGQRDDAHDGINDGITAIVNDGSTTVIEMSHPLNSGDFRDAVLAPGDPYGLLVFTTVIKSQTPLIFESTDLIPAWAARTVGPAIP